MAGSHTVLLGFLTALFAASAAARSADAPGAGTPMDPGTDPVSGIAARPLPFFYDLYTFRGENGTAVVAAFAVAAGELERENVERGVRYRFDVSFVLADTARRSVTARHDSVYVGLSRPLPRDHLLSTSVEMLAPPSRSTLQRVIMFNATTPGIGQLYTAPFPVPDYSGSHLMLSDIALGQPDATAGWQRGDVTLALLPTGRFPNSAFDVYYEIYNLPAGHRYTTEIAVDRTDGSNEPGDVSRRLVRLEFVGESSAGADASLRELRRVETSLARGRYTITVTITDPASGQSASRSRSFEVHSETRGATMVPALPVAGATARSARAG